MACCLGSDLIMSPLYIPADKRIYKGNLEKSLISLFVRKPLDTISLPTSQK